MGVNSPHYVGITLPSNGGSYNWEAGLLSSWNAGLSSTFSRWDNAGRRSWTSRLGAAVVLKCELQTLCWASHLRRGLQALCLSTEVVLRRGLLFLCLGIVVMLRCGLRVLRLGSASVASISLKPEAWTLLSDDLSSVIFRQSTSVAFLLYTCTLH